MVLSWADQLRTRPQWAGAVPRPRPHSAATAPAVPAAALPALGGPPSTAWPALRQVTVVNHQGTVIAFARQVGGDAMFYNVLDLQVSTEADEQPWTGFVPLPFPEQLRPVGLDIATVVGGFRWAARHSSILSSGRTDHQASIERGQQRGVPTEVLRIAERPGPAEPAENADLAVDTDLSVAVRRRHVRHAEDRQRAAELRGLAHQRRRRGVRHGSADPVVSTSPTFAVSALVAVPAEYQGRLRVFLRLNGNRLPADWSAQLSVLHVELPAGPAPRVLVNAEPVPGILLGQVTVTS